MRKVTKPVNIGLGAKGGFYNAEQTSRNKALELLPMLRERGKDKKPVRIDDRTIILKRQ